MFIQNLFETDKYSDELESSVSDISMMLVKNGVRETRIGTLKKDLMLKGFRFLTDSLLSDILERMGFEINGDIVIVDRAVEEETPKEIDNEPSEDDLDFEGRMDDAFNPAKAKARQATKNRM